MNRPLPLEERLARARAGRRAWWEAHPNYAAEYYQQNKVLVAFQKRRLARKRREQAKREEARKKANRRRSAEWRAANPERVHENRIRYLAEYPERVKASRDAYYDRHREDILERARRKREFTPRSEAQKTAEKRWRESNAQRKADIQRRYRADPEVKARVNEAYAAARRMKRRLEAAGLPPKKVPRAPAVERRQNEAAANEFFARSRRLQERDRLMTSGGGFVPTPPEVIAAWVRRSGNDRRWNVQRERFQENFAEFMALDGPRIREEVMMDSRARQLRGLPPLDIGTEVPRRVAAEVHRSIPSDFGRLYAMVEQARRQPRREQARKAGVGESDVRAASFPSPPRPGRLPEALSGPSARGASARSRGVTPER